MPIVRELVTVLGIKADTAKVAQADQALNRYVARANTAATATNSLSRQLMGMASGFLGIYGAIRAGRAILETNVQFERLGSTMETITGSAEGARQAMDSIVQLAAETPFQLQQVAEAFTIFGATGLDASNEALRAAGDLASAFGKDITEAAMAIRSAAYGEMEPLKQFGIIARVQGNQLAVTFNGVTETIGRNAADIQQYMLGLARNRYGGAMERQMMTLGGVISNLGDMVTLFMRKMGEAGLADALRDFLGTLRDAAGGAGGLAETLGWVLGSALKILTAVLKVAIRMSGLLKAALVGLIAYRLLTGLHVLVTGLQLLSAGLTAATAKAIALKLALYAAIVFIPLMIQDFVTFLQGGDSLIGRFVERFRGSGGILGALADFLNWMRADGVEVWQFMVDTMESAIATIVEAIRSAFSFLRDLYHEARQFISDVQQASELGRGGAEAREQRMQEIEAEQYRLQRLRDQAARYGVSQTSAEVQGIRAREDALQRELRMLMAEQQALLHQVGMGSAGPMAPAPATTTSQSQTINQSVGEVAITIQGSTGMGESELRPAVAGGVMDALRRTQRVLAGSGGTFT